MYQPRLGKKGQGRGGETNQISGEFARGISVVPIRRARRHGAVEATLFRCEEGHRPTIGPRSIGG
ncbi:MAG: hypothetical protein GQ560_02355 [Dehalococcoidia bacterium]|nr:hypothetical protein [Dehalococcoidia bacterium]